MTSCGFCHNGRIKFPGGDTDEDCPYCGGTGDMLDPTGEAEVLEDLDAGIFGD